MPIVRRGVDQLPLFVLIFVLVGLGVIIGGIAAWLRQHKWRAPAAPLPRPMRARCGPD